MDRVQCQHIRLILSFTSPSLPHQTCCCGLFITHPMSGVMRVCYQDDVCLWNGGEQTSRAGDTRPFLWQATNVLDGADTFNSTYHILPMYENHIQRQDAYMIYRHIQNDILIYNTFASVQHMYHSKFIPCINQSSAWHPGGSGCCQRSLQHLCWPPPKALCHRETLWESQLETAHRNIEELHCQIGKEEMGKR